MNYTQNMKIFIATFFFAILPVFGLNTEISYLLLDRCSKTIQEATCFCDAAEPWAYSFQETASPIAEGIVDFHDHLFYFLILILVAVTWIMCLIVLSSLKKTCSGTPFTNFGNYAGVLANENRVAKASLKDLNHGSVIEVVWTLTPAFILVLIAFPSFRLLYLMDEIVEPLITVKAVGFLGGLKSHIKNKIKDTNINSNSSWELVQKFSYNGVKSILDFTFNLIYSVFQIFMIRNVQKVFPIKNKQTKKEILTGKKSNLCKKLVFQETIKTNLLVRCFHIRCRAINRVGPHNEDILSLFVGSLLGDGHANRRIGEGVRFAFKQSGIHKEYLFWLYEFVYSRGYSSNLAPRMYSTCFRSSKKIASCGTSDIVDKTFTRYEFNTYTFRSLNFLYEAFYIKNKKHLSKGFAPILTKYLTPLALAVWIMDDGGKAGTGVRISTNNFTLEEVKLLAFILTDKYQLSVTIQKIYIADKYSIYIKAASRERLKTLIMPYMHESMYYKLS
jgi:hypothetical protein